MYIAILNDMMLAFTRENGSLLYIKNPNGKQKAKSLNGYTNLVFFFLTTFSQVSFTTALSIVT
jgi:hypothetical protein